MNWHELAKYPYPYYCACCLCNTFPKELCSRLGMLALVVAYVVGSAIEYYLFLLLYMFIMLITKIFSFCKCCTKKKEQTNPTNAPNDASQTPMLMDMRMDMIIIMGIIMRIIMRREMIIIMGIIMRIIIKYLKEIFIRMRMEMILIIVMVIMLNYLLNNTKLFKKKQKMLYFFINKAIN